MSTAAALLTLSLLVAAAWLMWSLARLIYRDGYGPHDERPETRDWRAAGLPSHPFRETHRLG
jgi:hypothetical protein